MDLQKPIELTLLRQISLRTFVARRADIPAVFMVDFDEVPKSLHVNIFSGVSTVPLNVPVYLRDFDWQRKSFPVSECVR